MVYLSRRPNLNYPPPEAALLALAEERAARAAADSLARIAADTLGALEEQARPAFDLLPEHLRPVDKDTVSVPTVRDSSGVMVPVPLDSVAKPKEQPKKQDKKKKRGTAWDL